jgi:hypothetical protein
MRRGKGKMDWMDVQEPDNLGAGLAAGQRDDVSADAVVTRGTLVLVSLRRNHKMEVEKIK